MKRGEIWIGAESGYASKPRPALIIQSDRYGQAESVITCLITSHEVNATGRDYRVALPKTQANGLKVDSFVMLDKMVAIPRSKLAKRIGAIESKKMDELYARLVDFLSEWRDSLQKDILPVH
ncbi:MAG: type II toxin-antitoxin system PemK/MazF family toxin [Coriobacteriales bacterium]|jgi:mRNA interferase MazF|nr:type II toxin-antitoxin system PemK/MazF family toxin [Coriobacteriales bacterium]